jgi:predicted NBD/HSP70 family sugar kinase
MNLFNGSNSIAVKEHNTRLIRRILKNLQLATKQQIAEATGLSTVTVGTILQELCDNNEVFEAEAAASNGGRPARTFRFNQEHAHVLVLFAQEHDKKDMIYMRVTNLYGEIIDAEDIPLPKQFQLDFFVPYITRMLKIWPTIEAIGFGLPGVVQNGRLAIADYASLTGISFTEFFEEQFGLPILLENDINAAVAGYCQRNSWGSEGTTVYIFFPQTHAPGAGIYINGNLHRGSSNSAGEIAYLPLGIDWNDHSIYNDFSLSCNAVSKVVISISGILNPDTIILHGEFLSKSHLEEILKQCKKIIPQQFLPEIVSSPDFFHDYQCGIIEETLVLLQK